MVTPRRSDSSSLTVGWLLAADRGRWEILWQGYNEFYERTVSRELTARAWDVFQADTGMHALGGRLDDELVGIVHFLTHASTSTDDVCYLQDLFTSPEARGRGVGHALIAAVTDWARGRDCSRVYWMTQETNLTARRLYDRVAQNRGFIRYEIEL